MSSPKLGNSDRHTLLWPTTMALTTPLPAIETALREQDHVFD